ncbi:hypothetical protein [Telmatospirillum sp.]|uniref:hypothetical protein n=1 Tax=Telmatospirillum sp. TaxID=2079197 RepID=UPI00284A4391|nr:hypothetical protein [Telmatospirillum sp.]MDR3435702.1 hypothetical protein [Telmatospirillum sp.]
MASTPKVGAATATSGISVPTRVPMDPLYSSTAQVERVSGAASVGFSDNWRSRYDGAYVDDDFESQQQSAGRGLPMFTPLVGRLASAFPASLSYSDGAVPSLFMDDVERGIGTYEFNMKLFAGAYALHGSVVNRYS